MCHEPLSGHRTRQIHVLLIIRIDCIPLLAPRFCKAWSVAGLPPWNLFVLPYPARFLQLSRMIQPNGPLLSVLRIFPKDRVNINLARLSWGHWFRWAASGIARIPASLDRHCSLLRLRERGVSSPQDSCDRRQQAPKHLTLNGRVRYPLQTVDLCQYKRLCIPCSCC